MRATITWALSITLLGLGLTTQAAEVRVLSAGAPEPGLRPAVAAFERASGHTVKLTFATAPQIRERAGTSVPFDVVIAPPAVLDDLDAAAKTAPDRARRVGIGRVGIGVAVRPGVPRPDIATTAAFTQALRDADSVVYNRASTGLYIETLLKRLNLDLQAKTTRYPDGASVMDHVLRGQGREIGMGASTEILLKKDQGLVYVGPLPAELQNTTVYQAAAAAAPADAAAAQALLAHLANPASRAGYVAAGIEPAD
jgi:molybdate transport system substrate-binding protein